MPWSSKKTRFEEPPLIVHAPKHGRVGHAKFLAAAITGIADPASYRRRYLRSAAALLFQVSPGMLCASEKTCTTVPLVASISATGEEVVLFTLAQSPLFRETKKK